MWISSGDSGRCLRLGEISERRRALCRWGNFGGITRGEEVAKGVILAQADLPKGMPIVVRLSGTGAEEGKELLKQHAGLDWGNDMREAAQKIVATVR